MTLTYSRLCFAFKTSSIWPDISVNRGLQGLLQDRSPQSPDWLRFKISDLNVDPPPDLFFFCALIKCDVCLPFKTYYYTRSGKLACCMSACFEQQPINLLYLNLWLQSMESKQKATRPFICPLVFTTVILIPKNISYVSHAVLRAKCQRNGQNMSDFL